MIPEDYQKPDYWFFLFVNTTSGGRLGNKFITLEIQTVRFILKQLQVQVSIYDLIQQKSRKRGLKKLRQSVQNKNNCRVIICGGDGTILWVVSQMIKQKIEMDKVPIGIIPIGTGNDFSRGLGWGSQQSTMIGKKLEKLKQMLNEWIQANVQNFDVWEIEFTVYEKGFLKKMVNGKSQKIVEAEYKQGYKRGFVNYCSFGIDGRVGYSFDKYRSNFRLMNYIIYAGIGMVKTLKPIHHIEALVQTMQTQSTQQESFNKSLQQKNNMSTDLKIPIVTASNQHSRYIFNNNQKGMQINEGFQNLVALNINSFMGGVANIWRTDAVGVNTKQKFVDQSSSDGIIEFVSWKGQFGLALQRAFNYAAKISQGSGPFTIKFKKSDLQQFFTYLQVDGQFYKVMHPKELKIRKNSQIPNSKIKVLRKKFH